MIAGVVSYMLLCWGVGWFLRDCSSEKTVVIPLYDETQLECELV